MFVFMRGGSWAPGMIRDGNKSSTAGQERGAKPTPKSSKDRDR